MSTGAATGGLAVSSSRQVVSWHNGAALWLVVGLATWFQSERAAVSLAPLLFVTALVAIDTVLARRARFASAVVDLTINNDGESDLVLVHFDRPPGGRVLDPQVLSDLVAPATSIAQAMPDQRNVAIPVEPGAAILGVEFVVASSGLGLVRSARSHTVFVNPALHTAAGVAAKNERRMPVEESLRSYQFGDSMRSVHWPSTARTGTLLVRAANHATAAPVAVVVERHESDDRSVWDAAVEQTTAVVADALSQQRPVVLVCRSVAIEAGSPLLTAMNETDAKPVAGNLDLLALVASVGEHPIERIEELRAHLAGVVPGPVVFEDEESVRIS